MNKFSVGTVAAVLFTLLAAAAYGASSPLDDLLPRPVSVEARSGTGSAAPIKIVTAPVPGAPSAVAAEAYILDIAPSGVTITASDPRGERYARVTLEQLKKLSGGQTPCCHIVDWPVLRWRGYMNDCGRNYLELSGVKAILDVMAAYKLNLFHWHLTDYHGWRLESKKYPELQSAKAFYGRQPGRFYTQNEFKEIVAYAAARGITVMPELDVPGHTLALRLGLGVDAMSAPGVGEKVTELFRELCSLAPADVMPFVHLGTDEARTREETCDDAWVTTWARAVNACGRKAVVWAPGKKTAPGCDVIDMAWYDNHVTNSVNPFLYADYVRGYNGSWTPFDVLSFVTFADPRHWTSEAGRQLGAIGCTWHDDNVGEDTLQLFRDCMVFPSLLGFADNYWSGRRMDHPEFLARLPRPGSPYFAEAVNFERRLIRQRDTVLADFAYPFPFVGQTKLRWRITDAASGKIVARDVPQGTVWIKNRRREENSFIGGKGDTKAFLETWIRSPDDQTVGAWIDCAGYYGAYTRGTGPTMKAGQWNPLGATVFVNGEPIAPPHWKQPDMKATTKTEREQDIPYSSDLNEKPLVDELPTLRPPTPVRLRKGWNHVRIVLPRTGSNWGATFCPIAGTSEHPREIDDLEYRSAPPDEIVLPPMEGALGCYEECPAPASEDGVLPLGAPKKMRHDWRIAYDYAVRADVSQGRGVAFDLFVEDVLAFLGCTVFLKSGDGWYAGTLDLNGLEPGVWNHVRLDVAQFKSTEGKPSGWHAISGLRLSLPFGGDPDRADRTRVSLTNFGVFGGKADVLVLRPDAAIAQGQGGVLSYAGMFTAALDAIGVKVCQVSDLNLSVDALKSASAVVLPWNPIVTDDVCACLEAYVKQGGKLIVCGTFTPRLRKLLGIREGKCWYAAHAPLAESITGYAKVGAGLPEQPDFAEQASWQSSTIEPDGAGEVIACWKQRDGKVSSRPAIVKTPAGYSFGHIWFGSGGGRDQLLASIVADACPALREGIAARLRRRDETASLVDRWISTLSSKPNERRLFWCHSQNGMNGKSWDETARFLKENKFTDLIVNLAWGGAAYYRSAVCPVHPDVEKNGDSLEAALAACRKYGIRLHVWQVTYRLLSKIDPKLVTAYEAAGRLQLGKDLKTYTRDGHWFCPTHPDNQRELKEAMLELVRKGVDGVHFDYIRYQGLEGCYCDRCQKLFEQRLGHVVEKWPADAVGGLKEEWRTFRSEYVSSLVRETSVAAHALRPGVEVSAAVFRNPRPGNFAYHAAQDWPRWCREGWVDFVCPMDYCASSKLFRDTIESQREFAGKAKIYPGLGPSCWPNDGWAPRRFGEQVMHCREAGFDGFTVFDLNASQFDKILPKFVPNLLGSGEAVSRPLRK